MPKNLPESPSIRSRWKVLSGLTTRKAREHSLVLTAVGIPHEVRRNGRRWRILVPEGWIKSARKQIKQYIRENPPVEKENYSTEGFQWSAFTAVFAVMTGLILFYFLSIASGDYSRYEELGAVSSSAIRNGEWWRAVTALTLHADEGHLFSNILFGGIPIYYLFRRTGGGLGWALVLLSGFSGNIISSYLHPAGYSAIGSSTALFGALGILGLIEVMLFKTSDYHLTWKPLAAAVALLAFLGTDIQSDIGAHFLGFGSGVMIGLITGWILRKNEKPAMPVQIALGTASAAVVILAWKTAGI